MSGLLLPLRLSDPGRGVSVHSSNPLCHLKRVIEEVRHCQPGSSKPQTTSNLIHQTTVTSSTWEGARPSHSLTLGPLPSPKSHVAFCCHHPQSTHPGSPEALHGAQVTSVIRVTGGTHREVKWFYGMVRGGGRVQWLLWQPRLEDGVEGKRPLWVKSCHEQPRS